MGALTKIDMTQAVETSPPADDALLAAATLLIAAGYRVIPPEGARLRRPDAEARRNAVLADDAGEEERVAQEANRNLSSREHDVLMLLAEGAANKVIARRLEISVHTAKFHVASILAKLGAVNRTDAIAIAMREGLVLV